MSLIVCDECEQQISDKADACPKCGCPQTSTVTTTSVDSNSTPVSEVSQLEVSQLIDEVSKESAENPQLGMAYQPLLDHLKRSVIYAGSEEEYQAGLTKARRMREEIRKEVLKPHWSRRLLKAIPIVIMLLWLLAIYNNTINSTSYQFASLYKVQRRYDKIESGMGTAKVERIMGREPDTGHIDAETGFVSGGFSPPHGSFPHIQQWIEGEYIVTVGFVDGKVNNKTFGTGEGEVLQEDQY